MQMTERERNDLLDGQAEAEFGLIKKRIIEDFVEFCGKRSSVLFRLKLDELKRKYL